MSQHEELQYRRNQKNIDSHFTPVYVYLASCIATFSKNKSLTLLSGALKAVGPAGISLFAVLAIKTFLFHPEFDGDCDNKTLTIAMIIALILCPIIASRLS